MTQMTGAEAAVETLRREGVEVVFGLPGVQIMDLYDAFYGRRDVRLLTVRHEQTAVYMADGYARVSGKPGVALVVPGPGVLNASAALGTAYASSSPVLLLAGQVESVNLGRDRGALHEVNDQLEVVRPLTKWRQRVLEATAIPAAIQEAMRQMRQGRPRPTHVEIPPDVLAARAEFAFTPGDAVPPTPPDWEQVRRAAALLRAARKPLIWAGGGVIWAEASRELVALAEALGAPVATTPEGKGSIPEDHPLALGVGAYGHGAPSWAMPQADVVLAVGTRLMTPMRGLNALHPPQRLIHLDVDPQVLGKTYAPEVPLLADARLGLQALLEEVRRQEVPRERWPAAELQEIRQHQAQWLEEKAPHPCEILRRLQRVLPDDAVLVSGITNVAYWSYFAYCVRRPRTYFTSSYFATLGYSFPLALGAKVAAPQRPVVALAGDGGFMYALPELATAVQYGIDVVVVVFVDNALGASKHDQLTRYGGRVVGTELHNPSFAEVARLFGAYGRRVAPERLDEALPEALAAGKPALLEVPIATWAPPFQIAPRTA
ncbi:MAG: acetolactate synthase I/II/III large subunit [Candidatus Tectimicrobiota bacterium]|nr:MAG: acetolactate synthase I/II/III large subunit [Candidatus Tectomicrobia bacterium]